MDAQGREHMMGDAFEATAAPRLAVKIIGTDGITDVDNNPGGGESYYYVRAIEIDRNLVWSSPIWVKYGW